MRDIELLRERTDNYVLWMPRPCCPGSHSQLQPSAASHGNVAEFVCDFVHGSVGSAHVAHGGLGCGVSEPALDFCDVACDACDLGGAGFA